MKTVVVKKRGVGSDVYIGRGSKWGNPYSHKDGTKAQYRVASRDQAIACYAMWLLEHPNLVAQAQQALAGKTLACFCKPLGCHGDVLAYLANGGSVERLRERTLQRLAELGLEWE